MILITIMAASSKGMQAIHRGDRETTAADPDDVGCFRESIMLFIHFECRDVAATLVCHAQDAQPAQGREMARWMAGPGCMLATWFTAVRPRSNGVSRTSRS